MKDSYWSEVISGVLGWTYVGCWCFALVPPFRLNRKLMSVEGMSLDTVVLNLFGSLFYLISVLLLYCSPLVRAEYAVRHGGEAAPLTRVNDIGYAGLNLLLVLGLLFQFYSRKYKRSTSQHLSDGVRLFIAVWALCMCGFGVKAYLMRGTAQHYQLLDIAQVLGTTKVIVSAAKYVPQAYWNYKRQSTRGFSVIASYSDLIGSIFALAQLAFDSKVHGGALRHMLKNPPKLLLTINTLSFSLLFIAQTRIYRQNNIMTVEDSIKRH